MEPDSQPLVSDWMSADWIAALGAAGTLLLSVLLAFVSLLLGFRDRAARRQAIKMEQAKAFAHVEVDQSSVRWRVVNASPYPIRQVAALAVPFVSVPSGKRTVGSGTRNLELSVKDIAPGQTHEREYSRDLFPHWKDLLTHADYALVLHFIDFEGNHWVRQANGKVVPIEKLKRGGFGELPRTLYEPDLPRTRWIHRLRK